MVETRELRTLEEAVSLLDEWLAAYAELEGQAIRLDRAWSLRYRSLESELHRLQGLDNERFAEEAAERLAALEAPEQTECPF